jgi:hypothetical protein
VRRLAIAALVAAFSMQWSRAWAGTQGDEIPREGLIADVRQLASILDDAHPDPYVRGGGRVAFSSRLNHVLSSIPDEGMTKEEFARLLRPLVASIGDQHTEIYSPYELDHGAPGGVPFGFQVVGESLCVAVAFSEPDRTYIGSLLESVEGVSVPELVDRLGRLEGVENQYFALRRLASVNLIFEPYLQELLPEWADHSAVRLSLRLPSGEVEQVTRNLPFTVRGLFSLESCIDIPAPEAGGFCFDFLSLSENQGEVAYLRVDHMLEYREAMEMAVAKGAASTPDEGMSSFPSATETFRSLVVEMRDRGTETLIIDLRQNGGGNYIMAPILVYFLYGKEALSAQSGAARRSGGGHFTRYSRLFFEKNSNMSFEEINRNRRFPLILGDIARTESDALVEDRAGGDGERSESQSRLAHYRIASTFYEEYQSEAYSGHYLPRRVLVLVTPWTSSSGLDMTMFLKRAGAVLIGTPSGQSPNSFGNMTTWELEHSGLEGEVPLACDIAFGDDPELGRVLPVDHPLTYEYLRSVDFDPNAELLFAIDLDTD